MMRSLFSGVSGLRVHQTKMDVIANNVSNVNTTGFKSSRVTFAEIFAQTLSGATAANETTGRGGVNAMQIGLGSSVASIDTSFVQGAAQRTDNPYDLMIQGDGFFIVGDNSGTYFTRAGAFNFDADGNLVNSAGMNVYGWNRVQDEYGNWITQRGNVQPIKITDDMRIAEPDTTKNVKFLDNLNPVSGSHTARMTFYDSLGYRFVTEVTFTFRPDLTGNGLNVWTFEVEPQMYREEDPSNVIPLSGDLTGTMIFDTNGKLVQPSSVNLIVNQGGLAPVSSFGDADGRINIDFTGLTQFGEMPTTAKSEMINGHGPGTLQDISIGGDGVITGRYSNGTLITLAQIPVARFDNPQGLEKYGDNLYVPTANSGEFDGIGEEAQLSGGKIMAGVLEMSNVDLAQEFTEMITTQRGFQANSRIITVSDDMLQELVNLKR